MITLRSPMHALLWKEWRALRSLRWAGMVLGALLPLCLIAGAELSRQGWSPLGSSAAWSVPDILREAVPAAFAFGLWPLIAILLVAQSLGGDRAAGTEAFLLERPVSRRRTWAVRLLVSVASIFMVMLVTGGLWAVWYGLGGHAEGWMKPMEMFRVGAVIVVVATMCGAFGSAILSPPILAILGSVALAVLPLAMSATLTSVFPFALVGGIKTGMVVAWVIVPLYLVAAYVATCTGEPAGRGRRARGLGTLALGAVATLFLFAVSAQGAQRWNAAHPLLYGNLIPSSPGDRLLVSHPFGGQVWLLDANDGRVLRYLPMPCYGVFWRKDGGMFAVGTSAGPLGSEVRPRISFFDRDGRPAPFSWHPESEHEFALTVDWDGTIALFKVSSPTKSRLVLFDPAKGETAVVPVPGESQTWEYAGRLWDGSPSIWKLAPGEKPETVRTGQEPRRKPYALYRVSVTAGAVESPPLVEEVGSPYRSRAVSPSGRWWRRDRKRSEPQEMIDLETGRAVPATRGGWPDDPVRFYVDEVGDASTLMEARGAEAPRMLRTWANVEIDLKRSPENRYLLVAVSHKLAANRTPSPTERWLYETASGAWKPLPIPSELTRTPTLEPYGLTSTWAGPSRLVWWKPGMLVLQDVEAPDHARVLASEKGGALAVSGLPAPVTTPG